MNRRNVKSLPILARLWRLKLAGLCETKRVRSAPVVLTVCR